MKARRRARSWLLALIAWGAAGCDESSDMDSACRKACATAETCGFLPSALGGADKPVQNCSARCTQSQLDQDEVLPTILDCLNRGAPDTVDWCSADSRCEQARLCMNQTLPTTTLGRASARISLRLIDESVPCDSEAGAACRSECLATGCADGKGSPTCAWVSCDGSQTLDRSLAEEYCVKQRIAAITFYVQRGQTKERTRTQTCLDALTSATQIDDIAPGVVHAGVEISGQFDLDGGIASTGPAVEGTTSIMEDCRTLHSGKLTLRAAEISVVTLALHASSACSRLGRCEKLQCDDNDDNDYDGFKDCSDPDCACAARVEICNDRLDNDADSQIDCQDSDCSTFPACLTQDAGPRVTPAELPPPPPSLPSKG